MFKRKDKFFPFFIELNKKGSIIFGVGDAHTSFIGIKK